MEMIIAFVVGMVVMDVLWAVKLGIPQMMYYRWRYRKELKQEILNREE